MTAPTLPEQISELNAVSHLLAANGGAIVRNGFGEDLDRAQIALGRQRALLEHLIREGVLDGEALREAIRKAVSESRSEEA